MDEPVVRKGILDPWIETGTEGAVWTVYEDGATGYEGMIVLHKGDQLTIFDADNTTILFQGIIEPDRKIGYEPYPMNPEFGQPTALGYWIHWTQAGFKPDDWAQLFFRDPPLRAEVTQTPENESGEEGDEDDDE